MIYAEQEKQTKLTEKAVNMLHLMILSCSVAGVGFKIYFDVTSNKQEINELKKKSEQYNKNLNELTVKVAVMSEKMEAIQRQNTALIINTNEIKEILRERK